MSTIAPESIEAARKRLRNGRRLNTPSDQKLLKAVVEAYEAGDLKDGELPELAGFAEACEILGVASGNLQKVAGLDALPSQRLKSGTVWLAEDLRRLAREGPPDGAEPRWTREAVLDAIRLFHARYGRWPVALDFNPAAAKARGQEERAEAFQRDGDYPYLATVQKVCGSWAKALKAARR